MAAYEIDAIITAIEARLVAQVANIQIMDRLDDPKENPRLRAHLGVRAWPDTTDILESYTDGGIERVTDTVEVESLYELRRSGSAGRGAALAFERAIRLALTNETWYRSIEDGIEVRYSGSERDKEEGWVFITSTFEVDHDIELGGGI